MKKQQLVALLIGICGMISLPTLAQVNKTIKPTKEPVKPDMSLSATELAGMVNGTDYTVIGTMTKTGPLDDYVFGPSSPAQYRVRYDPTWVYDIAVSYIQLSYSSDCMTGFRDCSLLKNIKYVPFYSFAPCTVYLQYKYLKPDYLLTSAKNGSLFNPMQANPTEDFNQYMVVRDNVGFSIMKYPK